jgi:hypothetical protein
MSERRENELCEEIVTLYRPVGQAELDVVRSSGWRRFPPRLPEQPIFYPVLTEEYAVSIARDWNTEDRASASSCTSPDSQYASPSSIDIPFRMPPVVATRSTGVRRRNLTRSTKT